MKASATLTKVQKVLKVICPAEPPPPPHTHIAKYSLSGCVQSSNLHYGSYRLLMQNSYYTMCIHIITCLQDVLVIQSSVMVQLRVL